MPHAEQVEDGRGQNDPPSADGGPPTVAVKWCIFAPITPKATAGAIRKGREGKDKTQ
jgi:hypothetical protein